MCKMLNSTPSLPGKTALHTNYGLNKNGNMRPVVLYKYTDKQKCTVCTENYT